MEGCIGVFDTKIVVSLLLSGWAIAVGFFRREARAGWLPDVIFLLKPLLVLADECPEFRAPGRCTAVSWMFVGIGIL